MHTGYSVTMALSVEQISELWAAARAVALAAPGTTEADIVDTIGPRELPQVEDCLAMLLQPERFAGCAITAIDIARTTTIKPTTLAEPAPAFACETARFPTPGLRAAFAPTQVGLILS